MQWIDAALKWCMGVLFFGFAVGVIVLIASGGRPRFPGWKIPRSREQVAFDKAFEKAVRRASRDPFVPLSGVPAAIDRVKADDGPLTVDSVLLLPGEVAVFDASGALVVWFPAPDSPDRNMICQKSITVLTYADMPQATPKMRDQLRLLKGRRNDAADK